MIITSGLQTIEQLLFSKAFNVMIAKNHKVTNAYSTSFNIISKDKSNSSVLIIAKLISHHKNSELSNNITKQTVLHFS